MFVAPAADGSQPVNMKETNLKTNEEKTNHAGTLFLPTVFGDQDLEPPLPMKFPLWEKTNFILE